MQIQCNDEHVQVQSTTLDQVLTELGYQGNYIATAVNGEFVPRTQRHGVHLHAGDRVEILVPMQGG